MCLALECGGRRPIYVKKQSGLLPKLSTSLKCRVYVQCGAQGQGTRDLDPGGLYCTARLQPAGMLLCWGCGGGARTLFCSVFQAKLGFDITRGRHRKRSAGGCKCHEPKAAKKAKNFCPTGETPRIAKNAASRGQMGSYQPSHQIWSESG